MPTTIRIATRRSPLAMVQTRSVAEALCKHDPSLKVELVPVQTQGDIDKTAPVTGPITGKGVFIDALRDAIMQGRAELAVHSMKDVPATAPDSLALQTFGRRADVRDALVVREGAQGRSLVDLPPDTVVGTSSIRRRALLATLVKGIATMPLRGNVDTRLRRLDEGVCDALLLASAGLDRLGLSERIAQRIDPDVLVPAPGQGALAVEFNARDDELKERLLGGVHGDVEDCVRAERELTRRLGADCAVPVGAHSVRESGKLHMTAVVAATDGSRLLRVELTGDDPIELGGQAANRLERLGAHELLGTDG